jgi:serine/threonine protein phosphatase PrpC
MGEKLEKPITTKISLDKENDIIIYGMSEMQGYKKSMEVFSLKNPNILEQNKNIFLFGLFDGHNGSEVAKYLSLHFSQFLIENKNFINGEYKKALKETFINIDCSFRALEVQIELSKYSSKNIPNIPDDNKNISNFLEIFEPRNLEGVNIAEFCGSSGIIILITEKCVFIANVGNSKCIPINTKNKIIKDKINKEHTINDENEIKRLKIVCGFIDNENENVSNNDNYENNEFNPLNYCPLITTRGFGDLQYKDNKVINIEDQYICVDPEIIEIPIEELGYLIIGNHGTFGDNNDNKLTINEDTANYFLEKCNNKNNNENKKISEIIEEFFDKKIQEKETNNKEDDNIINNMACIIIKFKHDKDNNIIIENFNEDVKDDGNNNIINEEVNENKINNDKEMNNKNLDTNNKNEEGVKEDVNI